jgi:hypothetical protein
MADLDKIVRPFQLFARASALAEKVLEARKPGTPVVLRIGGSGKGKAINGTVSASRTSFKGAAVVEKGVTLTN